jgi:hypothetical protein
MKTPQLFILIVFFALMGQIKAQTDTIALWTFENATKRALITDSASFINTPYTADAGIAANVNIAPITLIGSRFPVATASQWVAGSGGTGTFAPNSENWPGGANTKYWMITISTAGYESLKISSRQRSSTTGPRDFKVQYSTNGVLWTDVSGTTITCGTTFGAGDLTNVDLPAACNHQATLHIRWIMVSETSVGGSTVAAAGTNRIDDILISGTSGTSVISATLSPSSFVYNIDQPQLLSSTITWNDAFSITQVKNLNTPQYTLISGTDYVVSVDTIRFLTNYLNSQYTSVGQQHIISVSFDAGNDAIISVTWDNDSIYGALINPVFANYDLTAPGNVSTTITWNDATSIIKITDNQPIPYVLQATDYIVAGNVLTINQSYLASVFTSAGQSVQLDIEFNEGNNVLFTINSILSPPAPTVIATWNFENGTKRGLITDHASFLSVPYTADDGIPANKDNSPILLGGGNTFSAWVTGAAGTGAFAPNTTAWIDGADEKFWIVEISTLNYGTLTLSSKQRSSAGGPANFMVEYSLDGINWLSVPGSAIVCAENFTSGVLDNLPLPAACNNRTSLFLRWMMTTNTGVNGSAVTSTGTNRIDDIFIRGQFITNEAEILYFSFAEEAGPAFIDPVLQDITVEVVYGTDLTNLIASFTLSPNATATVNGVTQNSGSTANNFSSVVTYLVTAGDGITTKLWNVFVNVASPNDEAEIVDFSIMNYTTNMININSVTSTVTIEILNAPSLQNLIAQFELSYGAVAEISGVFQVSGGTSNDFSNPVIYTIIAQDGITQKNWTVNVTIFDNIYSFAGNQNIRTYPNPSTGNFMVELQDDGLLQIFDMNAREIYSSELLKGSHLINLKNPVPGILLLRFSSDSKVFRSPIIIE